MKHPGRALLYAARMLSLHDRRAGGRRVHRGERKTLMDQEERRKSKME